MFNSNTYLILLKVERIILFLYQQGDNKSNLKCNLTTVYMHDDNCVWYLNDNICGGGAMLLTWLSIKITIANIILILKSREIKYLHGYL